MQKQTCCSEIYNYNKSKQMTIDLWTFQCMHVIMGCYLHNLYSAVIKSGL